MTKKDRESESKRNYKSVKKKTAGFFSAPEVTPYDRALELNFLERYYRELCLTVMGVCMVAFGLTLTIIAIERKISDLYIIGPVPFLIGAVLLVLATGFSIKRCLDRPRIGMGIDFVESPDRLFLDKRRNSTPQEPSDVKNDGKPKSCLRKSSVTATQMVRTSPESGSSRKLRPGPFADIPVSPITTLPEVGGHDGESVRSTPEGSPMNTTEDGYPPKDVLIMSASPIDVLPPAEYISTDM